jgi:hypothetical protein
MGAKLALLDLTINPQRRDAEAAEEHREVG